MTDYALQLENLMVTRDAGCPEGGYEAVEGSVVSGFFRPRMADPTGWMYGEQDSEAMDETNWEAVLDNLNAYTTVGHIRCDYRRWDGDLFASWQHEPDFDTEPDAFILDGLWASAIFPQFTTYFSGRLLWVRVDSEADEEWERCSRSLADYPLLDEEAYSQREFDAWMEYVERDVPYDVRRAWSEVDDDTVDDICTGEVCAAASHHLDDYSGFTGEHSPDIAYVIPSVLIWFLIYGVTGCAAGWPNEAAREYEQAIQHQEWLKRQEAFSGR
jgi:hypothetical protein